MGRAYQAHQCRARGSDQADLSFLYAADGGDAEAEHWQRAEGARRQLATRSVDDPEDNDIQGRARGCNQL